MAGRQDHLPSSSSTGRGGGGSARGYKPGGIYLRPNSRTAQVLETLVLESARVQHALTPTEWRAAHQSRTGVLLSDLDAITSNLKRRGLITVAGGRTRALQYCASSAPQPGVGTDPYEILTAVVTAECARTSLALPLQPIVTLLATRGVSRTPDQVRDMLEMLTLTSSNRVRAEQVAARLERVDVDGDFWARGRLCWRPVGTTYPAPVHALTTRTAMIRAAVDGASAALMRPVSLVELKAWARAHPDHPAVVALDRSDTQRTRFQALLTAMLKRGNEAPDELRDVSHPLATDGGLPLRIAPPDCSPAAVLAARFTDACSWVRPLEELESTARLREDELPSHAGALTRLADLREAAVAQAFLGSLGDAWDGGVAAGTDLRHRTSSAADLLEEWWSHTKQSRGNKVSRWVRDAVRAAATAEHVERVMALVPALPLSIATVGCHGLRTPEQAATLLQEILRPEGQSASNPALYLQGVRRFTNPHFASRVRYKEHGASFSCLDVGDLLGRLGELTSDGPLGMTLDLAADLLGTTVRDPAPLESFIASLPAHERYYRHGAAVALGALGALPQAGLVMMHADDRDGLNAYALAVGLAPLTAEERSARLGALCSVVSSGLRPWLDEMIERASDGDTVTLAM